MKPQTVREHHDASRLAATRIEWVTAPCRAHQEERRSGPERLVSPQMTQNGLMSSYFSFLLNMEPNPDLASSSR
jgi:hypothetical protein